MVIWCASQPRGKLRQGIVEMPWPPTTHHTASDDNGHSDNEAINKEAAPADNDLVLSFIVFHAILMLLLRFLSYLTQSLQGKPYLPYTLRCPPDISMCV